MATDKVYKIKDEVDNNVFGEIGYEMIPTADYTIVKVYELGIDHDLPQYKIKQFYGNPEWRDKIYKPNRKVFRERFDLRYDKGGNLKLTPKFTEMITNWQVLIELKGDRWVGFSSLDMSDTSIYYNKELLDKYFPEEIALLKERDLIEEVEVENNEG